MSSKVAEAGGTGVPRREIARAWRNSLKLGASLAATWTVALLVRFMLPRYLGPSRFGDFNFAEAFAGGFFVLADLGIDTYSMREVSVRPRHASDYFGGILALRILLSLGLFGIMLGILTARGKPTDLRLTVLVFGLTQALVYINTTLATFLQASGRVDRLAIVNVAAKIAWGVGLAAALLLGLANGPLWTLVLPLLIAEAIKSVSLLPAARQALKLRMRFDVTATKAVLASSFPFYVSTIALTLGGRLNVWVLEAITTDRRELGWFSATLNLSALAMLLTPLLGWILLPLLSRARMRSTQEMYFILRRALEAFILLVIPVVLTVGLGADLWVRLALGKAYAPAAASLQVISVMTVLTYAAIILSMALVVLGRSWSLSVISIASIVVAPVLGFLLVPLAARLGEGGQATGAAIAACGAELFVVAVSMLRVGRGILDRRVLTSVAKALLAACLVVVAHGLMGPLGHLRLVVDLLLYASFLLLFGGVKIDDLRGLVRLVRETRREPATDLPPVTEPP